MTTRWPKTLMPASCSWGRSRNPIVQTNPISQRAFVSQRARPLWGCELSWDLRGDQLQAFRMTMEAMDGGVTPYVMWDFANPMPRLAVISTAGGTYIWTGSGGDHSWTGTSGEHGWVGTGVRRGAAFPIADGDGGLNAGRLHNWEYGRRCCFRNSSGDPHYWRSPLIDYLAFTPVLSASAAIGDTEVSLSEFPADTCVLVKGDLIELAENLYIVAGDVLTDSAGDCTVPISQGLVAAVTTASRVRLVEAGCVMRLVGGDWSLDRRWDDGLWRAQASFLEVA